MDPTIARMRRQPSRPAHEISGPATRTLRVDESAANQRGRLTRKIVAGNSSDSPALQRDVENGVRLTVALKPSHRAIAGADDLRIRAEQEIFFAAALSYIHEKSDVHSASGRITWDRHDDNTVHANFKCGIAEKVQAKFDEASRAIWGLLSGSTPPGVALRPNGAQTGAALNVITDTMEPDGDTNAMAVPLAVPLIIVGQLTSIADWFDLGANKDKAFRNLLEHQAGASKYFYHSDTASLADANSYLVFMENAKQIPKLCANARMAMESGGLALARDTFIAVPSGIVSAVASLERALRTVTTTIGAWFGMVTGAASIVSGGIDAAQGVTEYGVAKATIDASVAKRSVVQARVDEDVAERGGEASDLLTTINFTYQLHQTRAEKKTEVAAKVAASKIFKGSLAAAVGAAFLGVAIATAAGVALAYLGVPLLILSLAITVVFAVGAGIKAGLDRKEEKASAKRQCIARDIIQKHTRQELLAKYKGCLE
ncbi:MAG: hypothetical protein JWQ23_3957 [Herminiimonas sp.]|nr:hypothetical protein [Herminiimonas sp.]